MKFLAGGVASYFLVLFLFLTPRLILAQTFPTIDSIEVTQLHKNFEDPVHRYRLTARIGNPASEQVEVFWQVNCGQLDTDKGLTVVLTYSGDCSAALVIATVLNNSLYGQKLTQQIFLTDTPQIVNVQPKATVTAPSPTTIPPTIVLTDNPKEVNTGALAAGALAVTALTTAAMVLKKNTDPPQLPPLKNNESKRQQKDVCSCAHIKVYRVWTTGWLIDQVVPWNVERHDEEIGMGKSKGLTTDDQIEVRAVWNPECTYKKRDCRFWFALYVPHKRIRETKHDLFEQSDTFFRPEWAPSTVTVTAEKIEVTGTARGNYKAGFGNRSFIPGKGYVKLYSGERLCKTYEFELKDP